MIAQKILSAVARTGQRFGASYIMDVLRGSKSEKVSSRGHDSIPTFGLLKDLPQMRLGNYIDQLIDDAVLVRTEGEYPVLVLCDESAEVMRGDREVVLRAPKGGLEKTSRRRRRGTSNTASDLRPLNAREQILFDQLRELRRSIASKLGVPPYLIFSDATLEEFAREQPSSMAEMLEIKGVGQKKLSSFGEEFLAALNA